MGGSPGHRDARGRALTTGLLLGNIAIASSPNGPPGLFSSSVPLVVSGGITLGVSIPLAIEADIDWKRIAAGKDFEEVEAPGVVFDAFERAGL